MQYWTSAMMWQFIVRQRRSIVKTWLFIVQQWRSIVSRGHLLRRSRAPGLCGLDFGTMWRRLNFLLQAPHIQEGTCCWCTGVAWGGGENKGILLNWSFNIITLLLKFLAGSGSTHLPLGWSTRYPIPKSCVQNRPQLCTQALQQKDC